MRVWLIEEEGCAGVGASLEPALKHLAEQGHGEVTLVGVSSFRPDLPPLLRAGLLQVLVVNTAIWSHQQSQAEVLGLGLPILLAGDLKTIESWTGLAAQHAIGFVVGTATAADVHAALWSLVACHRRELEVRTQSERLQNRLNDRIVIEKAKGIVMQRLSITEEDAYQRLRMQSRRQRKQIREIAQSILDTETLMEAPGAAKGHPAGSRSPESFRTEGMLEEVATTQRAPDLGTSGHEA